MKHWICLNLKYVVKAPIKKSYFQPETCTLKSYDKYVAGFAPIRTSTELFLTKIVQNTTRQITIL